MGGLLWDFICELPQFFNCLLLALTVPAVMSWNVFYQSNHKNLSFDGCSDVAYLWYMSINLNLAVVYMDESTEYCDSPRVGHWSVNLLK